tara:strand:- start:16 stop:414 length:399 start_codon:yes stop_codon:yes gene_type:complete
MERLSDSTFKLKSGNKPSPAKFFGLNKILGGAIGLLGSRAGNALGGPLGGAITQGANLAGNFVSGGGVPGILGGVLGLNNVLNRRGNMFAQRAMRGAMNQANRIPRNYRSDNVTDRLYGRKRRSRVNIATRR